MSQAAPTESASHQPSDARRDAHQVAVRIAAVAGVFSLIACALLLYDYSRRRAMDPVESAPFKALKLALEQDPTNDELRGQLRDADVLLREEYFRQKTFTELGGWLLLGGAIIFFAGAISANTLRRKLPEPEPQGTQVDVEARWTRIAIWAVGVLAVALIGTALILSLGLRSKLPPDARALAALLDPASQGPNGPLVDVVPHEDQPNPLQERYPPPSAEEIRRNWPRFRGPGGLGISAYTNLPETFNGDSGQSENILWKTAVPLPGKNSPVVWEDRVFLSGANEQQQQQVFCFDADSGEILWQKDVPGPELSPEEKEEFNPEYTGHAAPTMATDGRRAFVIFATGDLAAFDFEGNLAWSRRLGIPENSYGHGSSLAVYKSFLLVQFDQGSVGKDKKSRLYAMNVADGKTAWEVSREVPNSWTSPIVIDHQGRDQLITGADPWVIAYDPRDGTEIWRAKVLSGDCGPSAVYAAGLVQVGNEYCVWSAIRPDGQGDVTKTHVAWTADDGLPDMVSPLATDEILLLLPSTSYFTCYDVTNGEMLWEKEFEEDYFTSSPSLVGKRVYLFSDEGGAFIFEPTREACKEVSRGALGEKCVTSPAFQDGRIYIRGEQHLFCIGEL